MLEPCIIEKEVGEACYAWKGWETYQTQVADRRRKDLIFRKGLRDDLSLFNVKINFEKWINDLTEWPKNNSFSHELKIENIISRNDGKFQSSKQWKKQA